MDPTEPHAGPQDRSLTREALLERQVVSLTRKVSKLQAKCADVGELVTLYNNLKESTSKSPSVAHNIPLKVSVFQHARF